MEDKIVAGTFMRAYKYGCDGPKIPRNQTKKS